MKTICIIKSPCLSRFSNLNLDHAPAFLPPRYPRLSLQWARRQQRKVALSALFSHSPPPPPLRSFRRWSTVARLSASCQGKDSTQWCTLNLTVSPTSGTPNVPSQGTVGNNLYPLALHLVQCAWLEDKAGVQNKCTGVFFSSFNTWKWLTPALISLYITLARGVD